MISALGLTFCLANVTTPLIIESLRLKATFSGIIIKNIKIAIVIDIAFNLLPNAENRIDPVIAKNKGAKNNCSISPFTGEDAYNSIIANTQKRETIIKYFCFLCMIFVENRVINNPGPDNNRTSIIFFNNVLAEAPKKWPEAPWAVAQLIKPLRFPNC